MGAGGAKTELTSEAIQGYRSRKNEGKGAGGKEQIHICMHTAEKHQKQILIP